MQHQTVIFFGAALALGLNLAQGASTNETELLLRRLYEACRVSQQQTGRFPSSLRDLGAVLSETMRREIPAGVLFENPESRNNQLRRRSPLGERTPCLRLKLDAERWLNVSGSGVIYESGLFWESEFVHLLPRPFANPALLARDWRPMPQRTSPRSSRCSENQIDLGPYCNAIPTQPWFTGPTWEDEKGNESKGGEKSPPGFGDWVESGVYERGKTLFDVRAVIQLDGELSRPNQGPRWFRSYPREVSGIVIGQQARFIHVLAGTVGKAERADVVAVLRLHYAVAPSVALPLLYGKHLAADGDRADLAELVYAMHPKGPSTNDVTEVRYSLYHLRLENPRPEAAIKSLDFHSGQVTSHPYLLAITMEP